MKIIETTTVADVIESYFGEVDLDAIRTPVCLMEHLGIMTVNTDNHKVESWYDRRYEWIPWITEDEDE